jgi:hypothetical protein
MEEIETKIRKILSSDPSALLVANTDELVATK